MSQGKKQSKPKAVQIQFLGRDTISFAREGRRVLSSAWSIRYTALFFMLEGDDVFCPPCGVVDTVLLIHYFDVRGRRYIRTMATVSQCYCTVL